MRSVVGRAPERFQVITLPVPDGLPVPGDRPRPCRAVGWTAAGLEGPEDQRRRRVACPPGPTASLAAHRVDPRLLTGRVDGADAIHIREPTLTDGRDDRGGARRHAELVVDVFHVMADGLLGDRQLGGNHAR